MDINEFIEINKDYIKCVYLIGSKACNHINNCHDKDILIIANDDLCAKKIYRQFKKYQYDLDEDLSILISLSDTDFAKNIKFPTALYQQIIYGEDTSIVDRNRVLNEDYEIAKKTLLDWYYFCKDDLKNKYWYYVLLGVYQLMNKSIELTDYQWYEVQLAHDRNISNNAINTIKDFLGIY